MSRDLSLSSRDSRSITPTIAAYIKFDLKEIKEYFLNDLNSITSMSSFISDDISNEMKQLIFQSQIILLESAFDYYLHNITKYGVNRIFERNWKPTTKYNHINMNLEMVETVLNNENTEDWFYEYITNYYAQVTMVSYESFKDQMNLIGLDINHIANAAFYNPDSTYKVKDHLKDSINSLYHLRNTLAHQSGRSHINASLVDISQETVNNHIENVHKIVEAIYLEAKNMG